MEEEEAEMDENDAGDGVRPKKRDDILYFRRSSKEFVDTIAKLNPRQVEAIHEIGFGGILDYKIPEIPGEMALWILSVFKRERCMIQISASADKAKGVEKPSTVLVNSSSYFTFVPISSSNVMMQHV